MFPLFSVSFVFSFQPNNEKYHFSPHFSLSIFYPSHFHPNQTYPQQMNSLSIGCQEFYFFLMESTQRKSAYNSYNDSLILQDSLKKSMLTTGQALYGLMQATQEWFSKFSSTISQHGFLASSYGLVLFLRCSDFGITILLRTVYCFLLGDSSISW